MTERRIQKDGTIKPIPTAAAARERISAAAEQAQDEALNYVTKAALGAIEKAISAANHRTTVFLDDWPRGTTDSMKRHARTRLKEHLVELGYTVSPGHSKSQMQVSWDWDEPEAADAG